MSSKLNKQTEQFCREYITDLNGKQAAIRAGYSAKTAEVKASQLLSLVKVQKMVQELMKAREERTEITSDSVLKDIHLAREIALGIEPHKMIIKDNIGDGMTQHVEQELHKTDLTAFVKLTELQMRHLGMFIDKQEVTHSGIVELTKLPEKNKDN